VAGAAGEVQIEVPRNRDATFSPQVVKKRQRHLSDLDAVVISLYAKGLTTGEISAHFAEVYGASVSKDTVSRITDRVIDDMQAWTSRPLLRVSAALFIDAIFVKVRDGQVGNQPFYAAIGIERRPPCLSRSGPPGRSSSRVADDPSGLRTKEIGVKGHHPHRRCRWLGRS
jgi:transposase-like protein